MNINVCVCVYTAAQLFPTLINQYISCDTENWSNDAEDTALPPQE